MDTITIGIADDHSLFREGIRMIISNMPGITLSLETGSGRELLEQLTKTSIDVVLLDIEMKDMNGVETLKHLSAVPNRPRVIMLSMHTEPRMVSHMMELGANSYLKKDVRKEELEEAIRAVHVHGVYFNESLSKSLLSTVKKNNKYLPESKLSGREIEVLTLICQEYTTQEIGEKLFISERTVEGHRKNLCLKLDVKNTAGLVRKAISLNLIEP